MWFHEFVILYHSDWLSAAHAQGEGWHKGVNNKRQGPSGGRGKGCLSQLGFINTST